MAKLLKATCTATDRNLLSFRAQKIMVTTIKLILVTDLTLTTVNRNIFDTSKVKLNGTIYWANKCELILLIIIYNLTTFNQVTTVTSCIQMHAFIHSLFAVATVWSRWHRREKLLYGQRIVNGHFYGPHGYLRTQQFPVTAISKFWGKDKR